MAFLVDDRAGEAYQIGRGPLGIGRDPVSHVIVLDPAVSRFHAEVRSTTAGFTLISMGATGTMLNGKPVTSPRLLTEGDAIGIGDLTFRFTRQRPTADDIVVVEPPDVDEDHVPSAAASDALTRLPTMVNRTIEPDADAPLIRAGGSGRSPLLLVAAATAAATMIAILIVIWRLRHR